MDNKNTSVSTDLNKCLYRLCFKYIKNNDVLQIQYSKALQTLGRLPPQFCVSDEFELVEKIKRKLTAQGHGRDAARFSDLQRKLQSCSVVRNRHAILHFLWSLSSRNSKSISVGSLFFVPRVDFTSTPQPAAAETPINSTQLSEVHNGPNYPDRTQLEGVTHGSSSGIGSSGTISSIHPRSSRTFAGSGDSTLSTLHSFLSRENRSSNLAHSRRLRVPANVVTQTDYISTIHNESDSSQPTQPSISQPEVSQTDLLQDLIFILQGIPGKWVTYDAVNEKYNISTTTGLSPNEINSAMKLVEMGWLYGKIQKYVKARSTDKAFGVVGQSFCVALNEELEEFYRLLALLENQLKTRDNSGTQTSSQSSFTLNKLRVWTFDPHIRLHILACLVETCKGKKGGALASAIYTYLHHGDPYKQDIIKQILTMVVKPIHSMIIRWICDGEIEDFLHEFFVAADLTVNNVHLWNDKYRLRKSMIPAFITLEQANRILVIGKSLDFLRKMCHVRDDVSSAVVSSYQSQGIEAMFDEEGQGEFQRMIDSAYSLTSRHLLHVLSKDYKFIEHLKAMRRYLLLGQGDFIRHLMDILQEDLAKPANVIYLHNLTGFLEMALRATNAQFDDPDILKRLDVRILEISPGDTGWDVFSLNYNVDGPTMTIFTPECILIYLRIFNFLWRAKRMEYILSLVWKQQIFLARIIKAIPSISPLLHHFHIISAKMLHFVQQIQYYINFEVLECSWDELLTKVKEAMDLDNVIAAHQVFLDKVLSRCLLDTNSTEILTKLRTIFDLTIDFHLAQEQFTGAVVGELEKWDHYEKMKQQRSELEDWAVMGDEEDVEISRRQEFIKTVTSSTRPQLQILANSYQDMVKEFVQMVADHQDTNLRFLSFRLDFNEFYNIKDRTAKRLSFRRSVTQS